MAWVYLLVAGVLEIGWAIGLKYTDGLSRHAGAIALTVMGMVLSYVFLALAMRDLPVGTAYPVWTGIGAVGTAIFGMALLHESRDPLRIACVVLIVVGVVGLKALWLAAHKFDRYDKPMLDFDSHEYYMRLALMEAQQALLEEEVPVGAVIVHGAKVIASAHNQREQLHDPTAHAEMIAITQAAESLQSWRLEDCVLYVTLEPCPMCAGAILQARIPIVVYGASDPKAGAVQSLFTLLSDARLNHRCDVVPGVLADRCGALLTEFFRAQRKLGKK